MRFWNTLACCHKLLSRLMKYKWTYHRSIRFDETVQLFHSSLSNSIRRHRLSRNSCIEPGSVINSSKFGRKVKRASGFNDSKLANYTFTLAIDCRSVKNPFEKWVALLSKTAFNFGCFIFIIKNESTTIQYVIFMYLAKIQRQYL